MRTRLSTTSYEMFCFRTYGEMEYFSALNWIQSSTTDERACMDFVTRDAWVWKKLSIAFNYTLFVRAVVYGPVVTRSAAGGYAGGVQYLFTHFTCILWVVRS